MMRPVFGITKALTNYLAGRLSDRFGRKHVLVGGWLVAVPVPFLLMWAPSWGWILFANALLGVSQGLTWSTTVIMKIDLAGPAKRGLAMGLDEFAGYFAVAGSALATGFVAAHYGLRPEPFYLGVGYVAIGLLLSALVVHETKHHAAAESKLHGELPPRRDAFAARGLLEHLPAPQGPLEREPGRPREQPQRRHGVGPLPALLRGGEDGHRADRHARRDLSGDAGDRAALHRRVVGSRRPQMAHRRRDVGPGSRHRAIVLSSAFVGFAFGALFLGVGTAMVYPTLLAAIGDVAHPSWRASSVGVYRLWRDLGYAIGALLAGITADALGLPVAMWLVAGLTSASGVVVAVRMTETRKHPGKTESAPPACVEPSELTNIPNAVVVDVRSDEEFAAGHIDGAVHTPLATLAERAAELPKDAVDHGVRQGRRTIGSRSAGAPEAGLRLRTSALRRHDGLARAHISEGMTHGQDALHPERPTVMPEKMSVDKRVALA